MEPVDGLTVSGDWLQASQLQEVFDVLLADDGEALIAGGAVRNAIMKHPVHEVDLSTTLLPEVVIERLELAGHKAIPTGVSHGTVTAVVDGMAFEVTTLREDIETFGRHAVVRFGTDWVADAQRRDLTINALYCDRAGQVFDPLGGLEDVRAGLVRFIGDAETRIREDALRILRFFRFFARYGKGRPDAAGLKACGANKGLIENLSAERVWMEFRNLLAVDDPGRALLWMRTTGILTCIIPESEKWGIDAIPGLIDLEDEREWMPDPLLRLMAMIRPAKETVDGLADRLLMSNAERDRLIAWTQHAAPDPASGIGALEKLLYQNSPGGMVDAMKLEAVHLRNRGDEEGRANMLSLLDHAIQWQKPEFPITGRDLIERGMDPGPQIGQRLGEIEALWIESGFVLDREALLKSIP